jgi:acyl-CoA synthetase (NDP forming)
MFPADLNLLLNPGSVAIIGASDTPTRIGGRALHFMLQQPFAGRLYPVNPSRDLVQGVKAHASIMELPESPDVAIIALADRLVPEAVDQLIARGTRHAVIFSSGFAETGAEGARIQAELVQKARSGGMRILGPNALGLLNTANNFWGTFTSTLEAGFPVRGRLAIASQSGAFGAHLLSAAITRGIGISSFTTTGNESDITTSDMIGFLADDPDTDVILSYLEGIRDGQALIAALERAHAARKPVIVMKAGRSTLGAASAQSHTASLAGNDAVVDAILRDCGALRISSTQEALDFAETALKRIYPVRNTLGVLTVSGGAGILIADDAERLKLPMPALPAETQARLTAQLAFASPRNPVDCTAQALNQLDLVGSFGKAMIEDGDYSSLLIFFSQAGGQKSIVPGLRAEFQKIAQIANGRLCVLCVLAPPAVVEMYRKDGFVVFDDPARAVAAIAAMGRLGEAFSRPVHTCATVSLSLSVPATSPDEAEAKALFASAGIVVPKERVVTTAEDAVEAAREIGLPVVMKIVSPDILHKTEIGGVLTRVTSEEEVRQGFATLMERAAPLQARINGVLIAERVESGVECIMGIQSDPVFGPVAMFGLGGIHVEVLKDVVLRRCPFEADEAREMITSIRSAAILAGVRGQRGVDIDALAEMLSRLSQLSIALGPRLMSIDVNPVIATPQGAWAVDAVIEVSPEAGAKGEIHV